ncbi:MAG: LysM peptidoglycan-binding domain-containing protein [candidate division Zixibacteria bacterium]|nr:LysM peptidoglycan-binding domain-containing protein [candidate division Zixibacteria bacterium]
MKKTIILTGFLFLLVPSVWANNPDSRVSQNARPDLRLTDSLQDNALGEFDDQYLVDSAYAVDDDIWRQLRLAEEYFAQGVAANQEAAWEEAQLYLERSLKVMADLDVDTTDTSPEAKRYNALLNEIIADYRLTLLSLGTLPEDASPSAFLEKLTSMPDIAATATVQMEGEQRPVDYNIPIVLNDKVKKAIIYFQTIARDAFERYLQRSGKYIPLMTEILKQYDVPTDLVYLPLIESGFNCRAYSWARASGPWQFIASTGKLYGLNRNWWYDERRDFVKSTHSAARFLKRLNDDFQSWELALAAYNGGPGRISRSMASQRTNDFWELDLKKQTEEYVPFYMAATIIAKNPELYGFHIEYDDPVAFEVVTIGKSVNLKTVAKLTGTTVDVIKDLNPELLRDVTPPKVREYQLRIPVGAKDQFWAGYNGVKPAYESNWVQHLIKKGETVSSIANRYGVSQYALLEANNLSIRSKIYPGKSLIVPMPVDGGTTAEVEPERGRHSTAGGNTYVVRSGDNLSKIAGSFHTTAETLRKMNYLGNSSRIYVGQVLKLPVDKKQTVAKSNKNAAPVASKNTQSYVVKEGDTVWDIARRFGVSTATLRSLNGLSNSARIQVGQTLKIMGSPMAALQNHLTYIVKRGDTLHDIARAFGTSVQALMRTNNISDAGNLAIGTQLKIEKE